MFYHQQNIYGRVRFIQLTKFKTRKKGTNKISNIKQKNREIYLQKKITIFL